ncbi:MAG: SusD/RagB family nutrient-binding outer membrane lipoprotein [Phycisphaerae bacterium]|nr:SusD/RagB family nutrient-binding outer membrane lipoprotein [Saprospiraceae bacterium]
MKKIFPVLAILLLFSCKKSFEELNTDPNNPVTADVKLVLTAAEDNILSEYSRIEESYDYMSGTFIRAFAGTYSFYDQWNEITNRESDWDKLYNGLLDAKDVIKRGTEQELWHHVAVAKILSAHTLGYMTDIYGDIPYSEALQGPLVPAPRTDTQQTIYVTIFTLLEESIVDLERTPVKPLGAEDFVYGGNVQKWKGLAFLMLARYHNHLSIKDPITSAHAALIYVENGLAAGFTSSNLDFVYPYKNSGRDNPWSGFYSQNPWILASYDFMNLLETSNDPRKENYWTKALTDGAYRGKDNSSPTSGNLIQTYSRLGGYFDKKDAPMHLATYAELRFIEAEAAFRSSDLPRAADACNLGIIASIDKVSAWYTGTVTGNDLAQYVQKIADYKQNNAQETAQTITLEKIMTQKYIAMFPMNVESWVDVRRHNYQYPGYHRIPHDDNDVPVATSFVWRGLYPQNEVSTNPNIPQTTLYQKLWWNE